MRLPLKVGSQEIRANDRCLLSIWTLSDIIRCLCPETGHFLPNFCRNAKKLTWNFVYR